MKIYDILPKINDVKLYFEIKENDSGASFGFFTKSELEKSRFYEKYILTINFQYIDNKRVMIIYI